MYSSSIKKLPSDVIEATSISDPIFKILSASKAKIAASLVAILVVFPPTVPLRLTRFWSNATIAWLLPTTVSSISFMVLKLVSTASVNSTTGNKYGASYVDITFVFSKKKTR